MVKGKDGDCGGERGVSLRVFIKGNQERAVMSKAESL